MKKLILSFISPCGRIGIGGFWWRQLALAVPFYLCLFWSYYGSSLMFGRGRTLDYVHALPAALAQAFPSTIVGVGFASFNGYYCYLADCMEFFRADGTAYVPGGWEWPFGILVALTYPLALLLAWCSFALVLRRLRDTRFGLRALPLCLAAFWMVGLNAISPSLAPAGLLSCLASLILGCWPSRKAQMGQQV